MISRPGRYSAVCVILLYFLSACRSAVTEIPIQTIASSSNPTQEFFKPTWFMAWVLSKNLVLENETSRLVVHALQVGGNETIIIISIAGPGVDDSTVSKLDLKLRDDHSRITETSFSRTLFTKEYASIGVIKFGARSAGASDLYLLAALDDPPKKYLELNLASFNTPPEGPDVFGRNYQLGSVESFQQNSLAIDFYGWAKPPEGIKLVTTEPPEYEYVKYEATLEVKDYSTYERYYIYIQFLSNGDVLEMVVR